MIERAEFDHATRKVTLPEDIGSEQLAGLTAALSSVEASLVPATTKQRRACLLALVSVYPPRDEAEEVAKTRFDLYHQTLRDVPGDILWDACMACLRKLKFFPMPSEILKEAEALLCARRRALVQLRALRDYQAVRPEAPLRLSQEEQDRRRKIVDDVRRKIAASAPPSDEPNSMWIEAAVVTIEDEPEMSDLATAILRARIQHAGGQVGADIEYLKRAATADARIAWPWLKRRGWTAQEAMEIEEV